MCGVPKRAYLYLDLDGADILQGRPALVGGLHRHEDQLLPVRLVPVEHLGERGLRKVGRLH